MALTNAQRQAQYRFRRKSQGHFNSKGTPMERLDAWVSADAAHGLRVLAALHGTTTQGELDQLLLAAIGAVKRQDQAAWSHASIDVLDDTVTR